MKQNKFMQFLNITFTSHEKVPQKLLDWSTNVSISCLLHAQDCFYEYFFWMNK